MKPQYRAVLVILLALTLPVAADEVASGVLNEVTLARAALRDIDTINRALRKNLEEQERAWPTREADQAKEMATPEAVQKLQVQQLKLQKRRKRRQRDLRRFCDKDVGPIIKALNESRDPDFLDAVIPVAVSAGKDDRRLLEVLRKLEQRFDVCPPSVINGLADLQKEAASLSLLELGMQEKKLSVLRAAGKSGDPVVISQLIAAAESDDKALATVCRQTLVRLTPPADPAAKLVGIVMRRIDEVRSRELKSSLIVYLGLCKNKSSETPLRKIYKEDQDERVRAAVIGALGNLGTETASRFLLSELKKKSLPLTLEKTCVHSLGAARYRPAVPHLIRLMDDPVLARVAVRALKRISGQDFGRGKGTWIRWWRAQPDAKGYKDPDE